LALSLANCQQTLIVVHDRKDENDRAKEEVIAETDGCLLPIVERRSDEGDGRKKKNLVYKEARLSLAHAQGSTELRHAGTFESVEVTGKQLLRCVQEVGFDKHTKVHCVGDGARWIADQVEEQFGTNGTYLIDFYHLCEYLAAAAAGCAPNHERAWTDTQKALLKQSQVQQVLLHLKPHLEAVEIADALAPVRACYRYIENRLKQLDYQAAIEKNLPIGSGEIESSHRYIAQQRLKVAGGW
jgi:Uncharacterised protein family (UPF0236)